ncbi:MAG: tetratricopeptide (TPR) repeat protein [Neolewinella sp.]|jgi:tetratricopeptide (TPR) repeat protein
MRCAIGTPEKMVPVIIDAGYRVISAFPGVQETSHLEKEDLYFPASAAFNYNQTNYWMLARIIEHASGPARNGSSLESRQGATAMRPDTDDALKTFPSWRTQHPGIQLEDDLNSIGYVLVRNDRADDAIKIFLLNTLECPEAWNIWDSLGESYEAVGELEKALKYYTRSVEITPDNEHGVDRINQLKK